MVKKLIEWTEADSSRGRKVVLFSTVFVFLFITIALFGAAIWGVKIASMMPSLYVTLVGLMAAVYGFYTSTSSDKSSKLADMAAESMMDKIKALQEEK